MPAVTPSLTDRYVAAVVRRLPADQQDDVARELRGTIEDTIDGRAPGVDELAAEREALEALGEPARLAADYANTPGYLIGPDVYVDYVRLLKLMLAIVPTLIAVVSAAIHLFLPDATLGGAIGKLIAAWWQSAVQVAFWTTFAYAMVERFGDPAERSARRRWSVDRLDELVPAREFTLAETVASIGFFGLLAAILLAVPNLPILALGGSVVNVFHPGLWPAWIWYFVVVLGASMVLEVVKYRTGRWTHPLAVTNVVLSLAFALPLLALLLTDRLLDPDGLAQLQSYLGWSSISVPKTGLAVIVVVAITWDIVDAFRKAARPMRLAG